MTTQYLRDKKEIRGSIVRTILSPSINSEGSPSRGGKLSFKKSLFQGWRLVNDSRPRMEIAASFSRDSQTERERKRERETRFLRDFFSSSTVVDRLFIHPPRLSHLSHSFNDDSYIFCRVVIAAEDPWDRGDKDSKGALGKTYRILGWKGFLFASGGEIECIVSCRDASRGKRGQGIPTKKQKEGEKKRKKIKQKTEDHVLCPG